MEQQSLVSLPPSHCSCVGRSGGEELTHLIWKRRAAEVILCTHSLTDRLLQEGRKQGSLCTFIRFT